MSHVVAVKTMIKNLAALRTACKAVGAEFREGQKTFQEYFGRQACDHAIAWPGAKYEVGLIKEADAFAMKCDYWSTGGITKEMTSKLSQAYAEAQVRASASAAHQNVVGRQVLADGSIRLMIQA